MDVKFCLMFPREALSVPVMRHVLGDALRGLGADDEGVADLLIAVTEACTNVVRHGGPGCGYEVVATIRRNGCLIEVLNTGPEFDTSHLPGTRFLRPLRQGMPLIVRVRRRGGRPVAGRPHRRPRRPVTDEQVAALPESGRGLAIMQACVDDVTLSSGTERGTVVSLQKRISWRPDAPLAKLPADLLADAG